MPTSPRSIDMYRALLLERPAPLLGGPLETALPATQWLGFAMGCRAVCELERFLGFLPLLLLLGLLWLASCGVLCWPVCPVSASLAGMPRSLKGKRSATVKFRVVTKRTLLVFS